MSLLERYEEMARVDRRRQARARTRLGRALWGALAEASERAADDLAWRLGGRRWVASTPVHTHQRELRRHGE